MKVPASPLRVRSMTICEEVRREDTGKEFLIGVFSGAILAHKIPFLLPKLALRFECVAYIENMQPLAKVAIIGPSRTKVVELDGMLDLEAADVTLRLPGHGVRFSFVASFSRVKIEKSGIYSVFLTINERKMRAGDFHVVERKIPTAMP